MTRHVEVLWIVACVLVAGACASSQMATTDGESRTYPVNVNAVMQAAGDAFAEAGLEMDEGAWADDSTFVIAGHRNSALLRAAGEGIQVAAVTVYFHILSDEVTRVRMVTSEDDLPAAASSADRRSDHVRRFFARLDARLR